ncbi:MAG: monoheme cytochrome C [Flavobacteriaceae bacterium]
MKVTPNNSKISFKSVVAVGAVLALLALVVFYFYGNSSAIQEGGQTTEEYSTVDDNEDPNRIENGIHVRTGLVDAEGLMTVVNNCTTCHSAQLVTQNRMDKERWVSTIRWMQKTQNLWDLGENEAVIVDYLVTNYPVIKKGRRSVLTDVEWYELKE